MQQIVLLLFFLFFVYVTLLVSRSQPALSALTLYAIYLSASVAFLALLVTFPIRTRIFNINYEAVELGWTAALAIFTIQIALVGMAAWLGRPRRPLPTTGLLEGSGRGFRFILYAFGASVCALVLLHAADMDWRTAWRASSYLALNTPDYVGVTFPPGVAYHLAMPVISIAAGCLAVIAFRYHPVMSGGLGVCFLYGAIFQAAAHSRWGGVAFLALAVALAVAIRHPINRWLVPMLVGSLGLAFYASAIVGRNSGNHGLATVFSTFDLMDARLAGDLAWTSIYSVFEGISVAAQASVLNASHSIEYKVLSFSLLPSAFDGFADIRVGSEVRVSANIPVGAWSEAAMFGYGWFALWSGLIFICLATNSRLNHRERSSGLVFINMALFVSLLLTNAYPIRNNLRILVALMIVNIILLVASRFISQGGGRIHASRT